MTSIKLKRWACTWVPSFTSLLENIIIQLPFTKSNVLVLHHMDFILCGTESTQTNPIRYKTYDIVEFVSIPPYKKCYDGVIFEF
jgi:hypothetical protein